MVESIEAVGEQRGELLPRAGDATQVAQRNKVFDRDFFVVGDFNVEEAGGRFFDACSCRAACP